MTPAEFEWTQERMEIVIRKEIRNIVIEECAQLVEDGKAWHKDYTADPITEIAAAIRALKDKP